MPTIIDTLVVELALDPTKFTQAQRQALASAKQAEQELLGVAKSIEAAGARMEHFFSHVKREAIGLVGAFFGGRGIKEFVTYITQADAALARLSDVIGVNASQISAWQGVARITGGTAETMAGALSNIQNQISKAQVTGDWGNMLQIFSRFGISLTDVNGRLKTAGDLMFDLNRVFSQMDPAQARAILQMLGMDDATIHTVLMNRDALRALYDEQRRTAAASDEDARAAIRLYESWERARVAAEALGRSVVTVLTPALTPLLDAATRIFNGLTALWSAMARGTLPTTGHYADLFSGTPQGAGAPLRIAPSAGGVGAPMADFLRGIGWLESDLTGKPDPTSSARGFFHFTTATAQDAMKAGLGDPRVGSYEEQAAITEKFIRMFHPEAAKAIDAGDFNTAERLLKGRWPSLPGGGQPQSPFKMKVFEDILAGSGPQPDKTISTSTTTSTVNVGTVNVNVSGASDPETTARTVANHIRRVGQAASSNIGPH